MNWSFLLQITHCRTGPGSEMVMAVFIGTSTANDLIGRCGCCDSHFTISRLTKTLRSVQFQKIPIFRVPPAPLTSSIIRGKRSSGSRSAIGSTDSDPKDDSPSNTQRSDDGFNAGPPLSSTASPGVEKSNPAQSALARALAYKKEKESSAGSTQKLKMNKPPAPERPKDAPVVEIVRGRTFQSRSQSTDASPPYDDDSPLPPSFSSSTPSGDRRSENVVQGSPQGPDTLLPDVRKLIEEKLAAVSRAETDVVQAKQVGENLTETTKESTVSLDAFKKAQAYKQQQAEMIAALKEKPVSEAGTLSPNSSSSSASSASGEKLVEVEIVTRDGVVKKLVSPKEAFSNVKEYKRTGVSSMDFAGLGFADRKQGGRKVIREDYQPPPPGALPEVEIITKDAGTETAGDGEESDLYKPKVSTWGLFPRPADISKAYGGGRTIRPGDPLETEEERIAREAKTQKLLADYKKKMGLDVDPRVKAECEKIFKQGMSLMESGNLNGAISLFEEVKEKLVFQSELHGSAALQGAICLDSLARFSDAKEVYEMLISHPNGRIRKQARQLLYGFRAMENLKVSTANRWDTTVYAKYFEAFADGYNNTYKAVEGETSEKLMEQTLAYSLLLVFPILLVVILALAKNSGS